MRRVMIDRDLAQQPALEFRKGHRSLGLCIVTVARRDVRSRRPRQKPQFSDHCADQPLDVATQMGGPGFADIWVDAVPHAGSSECLRPVRLCLIGMQPLEQAEHRVADIHTQMLEDWLLGQQRTRDSPPAPENRRVAEADVEAKNRSRPDFDEERNPRSSEVLPPQAVDQDNIAPGVIHLDKVEKALAAIFAGMSLMGTAGLRAHGGLGPHTARNFA